MAWIVSYRASILVLETCVRAECTLTNCQVGLNVHEGVCVVLKNNDISFNEVGLIFDGYGIIQDNKMWGNLHRSTIDLGKEALARAKVGIITLPHCHL